MLPLRRAARAARRSSTARVRGDGRAWPHRLCDRHRLRSRRPPNFRCLDLSDEADPTASAFRSSTIQLRAATVPPPRSRRGIRCTGTTRNFFPWALFN